MIGVSVLHFLLWLIDKFLPGPTTGIAHDDEEMGEDDDDWPGRIYIEGGA